MVTFHNFERCFALYRLIFEWINTVLVDFRVV